MTSTIFFFAFIPLLALILLAVNLIFAPHSPYMEKEAVFECGFSSFLGQNRTQFSISFFIFALLFLLFDLEILLVYPYLVSAYTNDVYGLAILLMFLLALTLGFAYELGKKALSIDSRQDSSKSEEPTKASTSLSSVLTPPRSNSSVMLLQQSDMFSALFARIRSLATFEILTVLIIAIGFSMAYRYPMLIIFESLGLQGYYPLVNLVTTLVFIQTIAELKCKPVESERLVLACILALLIPAALWYFGYFDISLLINTAWLSEVIISLTAKLTFIARGIRIFWEMVKGGPDKLPLGPNSHPNVSEPYKGGTPEVKGNPVCLTLGPGQEGSGDKDLVPASGSSSSPNRNIKPYRVAKPKPSTPVWNQEASSKALDAWLQNSPDHRSQEDLVTQQQIQIQQQQQIQQQIQIQRQQQIQRHIQQQIQIQQQQQIQLPQTINPADLHKPGKPQNIFPNANLQNNYLDLRLSSPQAGVPTQQTLNPYGPGGSLAVVAPSPSQQTISPNAIGFPNANPGFPNAYAPLGPNVYPRSMSGYPNDIGFPYANPGFPNAYANPGFPYNNAYSVPSLGHGQQQTLRPQAITNTTPVLNGPPQLHIPGTGGAIIGAGAGAGAGADMGGSGNGPEKVHTTRLNLLLNNRITDYYPSHSEGINDGWGYRGSKNTESFKPLLAGMSNVNTIRPFATNIPPQKGDAMLDSNTTFWQDILRHYKRARIDTDLLHTQNHTQKEWPLIYYPETSPDSTQKFKNDTLIDIVSTEGGSKEELQRICIRVMLNRWGCLQDPNLRSTPKYWKFLHEFLAARHFYQVYLIDDKSF